MKKIVLILIIMAGYLFSITTIHLWHAYRGDEKRAIERVAKSFNIAQRRIKVKLLPVPFGGFNDKITSTIGAGGGPDVFIFAQDYIASWAKKKYIKQLNILLKVLLRKKGIKNAEKFLKKTYITSCIKAFEYKGRLYGIPGSFKNLVLFYNRDLCPKPPRTMSQLIKLAEDFTDPNDGQFGRWGFPYEMGNFYYHTMWIQGFGGKILVWNPSRRRYEPRLDSQACANAAKYALRLWKGPNGKRICPEAPSGTLITQLFNSGKAMFTINGQWFRGEISKNINYGVAPLPIIDDDPKAKGRRAIPFLTVEGYFIGGNCRKQKQAVEVILYFTNEASQRTMAVIGKHTPANKKAYKYPEVKNDPISRIFRRAARNSIAMPSSGMEFVWGPATTALNNTLGEKMSPEAAFAEANRKVIQAMKKAGVY